MQLSENKIYYDPYYTFKFVQVSHLEALSLLGLPLFYLFLLWVSIGIFAGIYTYFETRKFPTWHGFKMSLYAIFGMTVFCAFLLFCMHIIISIESFFAKVHCANCYGFPPPENFTQVNDCRWCPSVLLS